MIEALAVTALPVMFLSLLYGGEAVRRFRRLESGDSSPIGKALFVCCKWGLAIPWGAMILLSWGLALPVSGRLAILRWPALVLWILGFALLFSGRLGLGSDFRMGLAREKTRLKENGVFRLSRNPMYLVAAGEGIAGRVAAKVGEILGAAGDA